MIPVHNKISDMVKFRLENKYLVSDNKGNKIDYATYRKDFFDPLMVKLGMSHTPHETRHTFATFAKLSKVDELARKMIMGHTIKDFTDSTYTHYDLDKLTSEMDKLIIL